MSTFGVKLPDVGEGVAEAELISWCVAVGDRVSTESVLAEVMTDKATVEIASPVNGVITALHGEPGDLLAVGSELVAIELDGAAPGPAPRGTSAAPPPDAVAPIARPARPTFMPARPDGRALASPAVRARAVALGIDLSTIAGTGPDGRVVHADLDDQLITGGARPVTGGAGSATGGAHPLTGGTGRMAGGEASIEVVRGLRRRIAERLTSSWTEIPHITYVEGIDVTDLEALRAEINSRDHGDGIRLTILPFLARAMVIACGEQPRLNATYDRATQSLSLFDAVHLGIATQTDDGLMVPVVRHAEARRVRDLAAEIARVSTAARAGTATRDELSGSTITITSLGALGGLVTTPIINQPEVAIVGVNKLETRPVWRNGAFEPRQMMNLSSSFDHRMVDGWDAATFVQRIKALLEMPALLFVDDEAPDGPLP